MVVADTPRPGANFFHPGGMREWPRPPAPQFSREHFLPFSGRQSGCPSAFSNEEAVSLRKRTSEKPLPMMRKVLMLMVLLTICAAGYSTKEGQVEADLKSLDTSMMSYKLLSKYIPPGNNGFQFLIERPASLRPEVRWNQILKKLPMDPWKNPYCFVTGDGFPDGYGIYSRGPDGISGTQGNDRDDLNSWRDNPPETPLDLILWGIGTLGVVCGLVFAGFRWGVWSVAEQNRDPIAIRAR